MKNPCVDSAFVTVVGADLDGLSYTLGKPATSFAAHAEFTIQTLPNSHELCGEIEYRGRFADVSVQETGESPLSYDATTRVFTAESSDVSLLDDPSPRIYQV